MNNNLLFHSLSITKVISTGCLLILIFSGAHILNVLNTFTNQTDNYAAITRLVELQHTTDTFIMMSHYEKTSMSDSMQSLLPLVEYDIIKNYIWDVTKLNKSNKELHTEFTTLQQQIKHLSLKKIEYRLGRLSYLITISMIQYKSLIQKQSYLVKISEVSAFLLIACCALFLLGYCRRHIVRPLKMLEANVTSIGNHDFNLEYPDYDNEVGTLSSGMQSMSSELETLINAMQKKVFDQTAELEKANDTIHFLYTISQQLSTVELTHPIIIEALNALAKHTNLDLLCLEFVNGTQLDSNYGCATYHKAKKRIPIVINGKPFGYLNYVQDAKHSAAYASIISSFSSLLARALYQEEYNLQEQKFLLMEERGVIARELHDSIAQALSFLKIQCTVLHRQIETNENNDDAIESVNNIEEAVSDAYVQLRSLLSTFRLNISVSDFKEAVLVMISQLQKQTTAQIKLGQFESNFQTHANQHIHLLQIIREAVTNAMKHANCNTITINTIIVDKKVNISIIDDGIGIGSSPGKVNHYGMEIMNQRAAELDAELQIQNLSVGTEIKLIFSI